MSQVQKIRQAAQAMLSQVEKVVHGKRMAVHQVLVCLLADGHLLIEDVPGTAKTLLAKALARTMSGRSRGGRFAGETPPREAFPAETPFFSRLQCTPDLLPGDVTGSTVFNPKEAKFVFHPGPVFTHVLLADEINRATPRAQAALLECMAERQVSAEGKTHRLPSPFFVIATQNPVEHEGTFPLPEAQLDRFLMKISVGYPDGDAEMQMLASSQGADPLEQVQPVLSAEQLGAVQQLVAGVHVSEAVRRYVIDVVASTRSHRSLVLGASPRATKGLFRAAQASAAISGREFVTPDDVKMLYPAVLYHRCILGAEARLARRSVEHVVDESVGLVPVPMPTDAEGP